MKCVTFVLYNYYWRLTLKKLFTDIEETPLNLPHDSLIVFEINKTEKHRTVRANRFD